MGLILHRFANGYDDGQVCAYGDRSPIKSIGNSWTTPRDLQEDEDAWVVLNLLAESIGARLRELNPVAGAGALKSVCATTNCHGFPANSGCFCQLILPLSLQRPPMTCSKKSYHWYKRLRSLGVRGFDLVWADDPIQLRLDVDANKLEELMRLYSAIDDLRRRYGFSAVQRAKVYTKPDLAGLNAKDNHTVHLHGYFGQSKGL